MMDRQGIEVDFCPKCRGVWLDRGELDKLIERSAQSDNRALSPLPRDGRDDFFPDYDDDGYKPKNDDRYYSDDRTYPAGRKKKSFLSNMFDIFD
jgi:Zn-finger nucleic acid-binding protein